MHSSACCSGSRAAGRYSSPADCLRETLTPIIRGGPGCHRPTKICPHGGADKHVPPNIPRYSPFYPPYSRVRSLTAPYRLLSWTYQMVHTSNCKLSQLEQSYSRFHWERKRFPFSPRLMERKSLHARILVERCLGFLVQWGHIIPWLACRPPPLLGGLTQTKLHSMHNLILYYICFRTSYIKLRLQPGNIYSIN